MSDNCILQVEDEEADVLLLRHGFTRLLKGWWLGLNEFTPIGA